MRTLAYVLLHILHAVLCICGIYSMTFLLAARSLRPTLERMEAERRLARSRRRLEEKVGS